MGCESHQGVGDGDVQATAATHPCHHKQVLPPSFSGYFRQHPKPKLRCPWRGGAFQWAAMARVQADPVQSAAVLLLAM